MAVDCDNLTSLRRGSVSKPCEFDNTLGFVPPGGCTVDTARAWRSLASDLVKAVPDEESKKADLVGRLAALNFEYDLREVGVGGDQALFQNPWKLNTAAKRYAFLARDACKVVPASDIPPEVAEKVPLLDGLPSVDTGKTVGLTVAGVLVLGVGGYFALKALGVFK